MCGFIPPVDHQAAAALQSCIVSLGGSDVSQAASCGEGGAELQAAPSHGLVICAGGGECSWTPERLTVSVCLPDGVACVHGMDWCGEPE